ncbi:hypothetical protein MMB17_03510 [Methylobacterium organophilum]|nr:hypothetical protein [Methylobacterium organophilum]UMY18419.1 hypothetical protein MMB17_03510 [Methylobacterium organophilum]
MAYDPRILPAHPRYARNAACADITVVAPARRPGTHPLDGKISPDPAESPMSQGDSAICFAYATADMISQRVGRTVSALDVATRYYFADPARLAASRDPALRRYLRENPDTLAEIAASRNDTDVSKDGNPGRLAYFDKLEDGQEDAAALLYNVGGLCEDRDLPSFDGYGQHQKFLRALRWRARVVAPKQCWRSLAGTVEKLRSAKTDAFNAGWLAHVEARCRRRPLPVPLLPVSYRVADNQLDFMDRLERGQPPTRRQTDRLLAMVDYALDHGRIPTVGYSWYVLEDRDPKDPDLAADHSSPILARRSVEGRCQYHLQDNTGEYCARMRPGIRERCDLGRVWLEEDELRRSLYSVIYLR